MPVPPAIAVILGGPKLAAAKAAAFEILPTITSASMATILARLVWKRVPDWVKEDVSFRNTNSESASSSSDVERLAAILEKIQAWIEACSDQLQRPVPHLCASFLIYWQLVAQQQRQRILQHSGVDRSEVMMTGEGDQMDEDGNADFETLKDMLNLAIWAYFIEDATDLQEKLETLKLELKSCALPSRPGSVGYYVAFDRRELQESKTNTSIKEPRRTMILGVRGTSTLEEILTDACGQSVSYRGPDRYAEDSGEGVNNSIRIEVLACEKDEVLFSERRDHSVQEDDVEVVSGHERIYVENDSDPRDSNCDDPKAKGNQLPGRPFIRRSSNLDSQIRCHEGILMSAKRLFLQVRPLVEEHVVLGDHRLVIVGHSLGASAGCLLALMLRSRYPELIQIDRLHVYAFGPPPVLDYDSAIGASSYVTSVVHKSDLISRCSVVNLTVFLELLSILSSYILIAGGLAPTNPRTVTVLVKQLAKGDNGEPLWSEQDLRDAMAQAQRKVTLRDPDHLFVPGKVLLLSMKDETNSHQLPANLSEVKSLRYSWTLTDGTAPSLRVIEMNGYQMLADHTTAAYMVAITSLADQT